MNPLRKGLDNQLAKIFGPVAIEICGDDQLGTDIPGGPEIIVHLARTILNLHPVWAIIKTDSRNAFNSLLRKVILEEIKRLIPGLFPYVNMKRLRCEL